jgi:hypothetical protein
MELLWNMYHLVQKLCYGTITGPNIIMVPNITVILSFLKRERERTVNAS